MTESFLPTTKQEMVNLGWDRLDFLVISGDAYVDHPSFGSALIGRYLEFLGFKVGIIPQPDWRRVEAIQEMGVPKLAVLISAGNLDSMINHYTARKNPRIQDAYSPGGEPGQRPDRATIVYTNLSKQAFPSVPVIIGGIEASLRRFVHYDYWDDRLRRSILFDSKADMLIYGMAEKQLEGLALGLREDKSLTQMTMTPGICYISPDKEKDALELPSYEECLKSKEAFAESFRLAYQEQDPLRGKRIVQEHQGRFLVQNPPAPLLTGEEMDSLYNMPFRRTYHPRYKRMGVPALNEVKFSITSHRGCYGACSFCALHFHQGRMIQARTQESIIKEAVGMTLDPEFKGYIHDVGGPTANFRDTACTRQQKHGTCKHKQCLFPKPCSNLKVSHANYLKLLRRLRDIPGVKKVFVRSGLRYDYLLLDKDRTFLTELCKHHISGQLKVAPEHASHSVTTLMGKPSINVFDSFRKEYESINKALDKKQYLIPYFMSGHPGTTLRDAVTLAEYLRDMNFQPDQVQEFIPTPGSLSTSMYYTGINPFTKKKVHIPRGEEKAMQRALLQYKKPENRNLVLQALKIIGREDLIGFGPKALIAPSRKPFSKVPTPQKRKKGR